MSRLSQAWARSAVSLPRLRQALIGSRHGIQDVVLSMIPQGVRVITGLASSILIARGLGPAGLGQYTLVLSLSEVVAQLSDLGIGQTTLRYASRAAAQGNEVELNAVLRWAFRLRLVLLFCLVIAGAAISPYLAERVWRIDGLAPLLRLGLMIGALGALSAVPTIYYQSLRQFGRNATVQSAQMLISFAGILALAWLSRWSVASVTWVQLLAGGIATIVFFALMPKDAVFSWKEVAHLGWRKMRALWLNPAPQASIEDNLDNTSPNRFAFFMFLSTVIVMLTLRADVWLIGVFLDEHQVGLYSAALRVTLPLAIVLGAINTALWPRASAITQAHAGLALLKKTVGLCGIVSVGTVIYALVVPMILPWAFGDQYTHSVLLGQLLCLRYALAVLLSPVGVIGYSFGLVRTYWKINLVQFVIVIVFNLLLLPRYGPAGSAIALIANEAVGGILVGLVLWKKINASL